MKTVASSFTQMKGSDAELKLMHYWHLPPYTMSTETAEEAEVFTLDEDVFERALEDIEENPYLYGSFSG